MKRLPEFSGTDKEKARQIVNWVEDNIHVEKMRFRDYFKLGVRTPAEILASKRTNPSFMCLDKAAVIGLLLKKNGFDAYIRTERILHEGKPVGLHFTVQGKRGDNKFTVDPRPLKTYFVDGWYGPEREYTLALPICNRKNAKAVELKRKEVAEDSMNTKVLNLAGIRGRLHFFTLLKLSPLRFAAIVLSRSGRAENTIINYRRQKAGKSGGE